MRLKGENYTVALFFAQKPSQRMRQFSCFIEGYSHVSSQFGCPNRVKWIMQLISSKIQQK